MNKKISLNGIELSLPKYDATAVTLFDYLENIVSNLEDGLDENDGNFQISINVDFETRKSPKYTIHSNGTPRKKTKDKIARILRKTKAGKNDQVSGSVRVNLKVEDR